MALELVAGHAINNLGLGNVLPARGVAEFNGNTGVLQARAGDTVNIFIDAADAEYQDYEYAASVVNACSDYTVYAVRCTAGSNEICSDGYPVCCARALSLSFSICLTHVLCIPQRNLPR
ncbi:hypothetical protein O1611_g10490 [Lasiodiplodia mahajangana]|uniref:Uncharacterized protein n=1 Tax=Lasiodiplodia mahajangana TaxID=1108764 RepID=A0ACC2IXU0_9PEZI|nr:hypothetical protein O1611_g10490 [Lasiodiplodia mahajangana]